MEKVLSMLPAGVSSVLEIGARNGVMTRKLAHRVPSVTALDLRKPPFQLQGVVTVEGNVESLQFDDDAFDCVVCTEVLEHVPQLTAAAHELTRVSREFLLLGVPYRQDTRVGRTTCSACGKINPPYGHINAFDEKRLTQLFPGLRIVSTEYCAENKERTNSLSVWLQDLALNPYGSYEQDEPCISCGGKLVSPRGNSLFRRVACALGVRLYHFQSRFSKPLPTWILVLFRKEPVSSASHLVFNSAAL